MLIRSKASKVPDLQVWVFCHSGIVGSGSQAKSYLCITRSRLEYTYVPSILSNTIQQTYTIVHSKIVFIRK